MVRKEENAGGFPEWEGNNYFIFWREGKDEHVKK